MKCGEDPTGNHPHPSDRPSIRWRPWPCESCGGEATALGFLGRSPRPSETISEVDANDPVSRNRQIDELKKWEACELGKWVALCSHTGWSELHLPKLAEGSEHLVLFDEDASEVVKVTRPGLYGDYYEIHEGKIVQYDNTPEEYLRRMGWWETLFSAAPEPVGVTERGQIVSRQKFIVGDEPSQVEVDRFLEEAGLTAVRQNFWIWKKIVAESPNEIWIGDARSDNFVSAKGEIIPIDIRIWGVPVPTGK
jgi:hypothetical protein